MYSYFWVNMFISSEMGSVELMISVFQHQVSRQRNWLWYELYLCSSHFLLHFSFQNRMFNFYELPWKWMSEFLLTACNYLLLFVCRMSYNAFRLSLCLKKHQYILDPYLSCPPMAGSNLCTSFLPFGCPAFSWRSWVANSETTCSCVLFSSTLELFFPSNLSLTSTCLVSFFLILPTMKPNQWGHKDLQPQRAAASLLWRKDEEAGFI